MVAAKGGGDCVGRSAERPIAKLTRPGVAGLVARERLMALLDAGSAQPLSWVSGPAGSGKTSLVLSYLDGRSLPCIWYRLDEGDADVATFFYYLGLAARRAAPRMRRPLPLLTPEYVPGLGTFTRRYFEALCASVGRPFALVLDDYQEVPERSAFHEVLRHGISAVPEGVRVLVMSRGPPTSSLARLQASSSLCHVGWQDLRFSVEEVSALVRVRRVELGSGALQALHDRTEGWAAGIVLLLARLQMGAPGPASLARATPEEVFNFFAGELFDRADEETRTFLLRSSLLPTMTVAAAEALTGNPTSARILAELRRRHYFTATLPGTETVYQYHPLFRDFLVHRAEAALPGDQLAALRRSAGGLLEREGQTEPAADLFIATRDWEALARLVQGSASALIAQGRTATLERWLHALPADLMARSPWLAYWWAASLLPSDPVQSRRQYERAFALFEEAREPDGLFLSWAGAMEAALLSWGDLADADRWISVLERLLREGTEPPTPEIWARVTTSMLFALTLRQPQHPEMLAWAERARAGATEGADARLRAFTNVYLELYYLWVGDHCGAELVLEGVRETTSSPDAPPLARILGKIIEAVYRVRMAEHGRCRRAVEEGLEIATTSGVVIWNSQLYSQGALNALSEGDREEAARYLRQMGGSYRPARRIDACMYHFSSAWLALLERQLPIALEHAGTALRLAVEAGTPFHEGITRIAHVHLLLEQGDRGGAAKHLARAAEVAAAMRSRILAFMVGLCEADLELRGGDEAAALDALGRALGLGREQGYVNFYWWRPEIMARLCGTALEAGIEVAYAQRLVRQRRLVPPSTGAAGERWPWPVRIRTLGGFELCRDGEPVTFARKVQRKPLALLKTLVALGGREVAEAHLLDELWPDADGDLARRSLETCLHRLRKLMGHDDAVRVKERRFTLDERRCHVDLWAVEEALSEIDAACRGGGEPSGEQVLRTSEAAIARYRGHFLPADAGPAVLRCRERVRRRYLQLVLDAGERIARTGAWDRALRVIQRAVEVEWGADAELLSRAGPGDPGAEAAYRRGRELLARRRASTDA
jgi:ATP/maltotriose-dependent transcriptional regulator MalT